MTTKHFAEPWNYKGFRVGIRTTFPRKGGYQKQWIVAKKDGEGYYDDSASRSKDRIKSYINLFLV